MVEVTIDSVRERTDIDGDGQFIKYYDILFYVDGARHHLRMEHNEYTAAKAEAAVKAKAAELAAVTGKKITLGK